MQKEYQRQGSLSLRPADYYRTNNIQNVANNRRMFERGRQQA